MVVMLPISSLCTSFFIVKTVVMHDRKMIKSKFLYFMKLFLNYYICLTIFSSLTIRIIIENNAFRAFQKLNDLTRDEIGSAALPPVPGAGFARNE